MLLSGLFISLTKGEGIPYICLLFLIPRLFLYEATCKYPRSSM